MLGESETLRQARNIRREARVEKREAIAKARREQARKIKERMLERQESLNDFKSRIEYAVYRRRILLLTRLRIK